MINLRDVLASPDASWSLRVHLILDFLTEVRQGRNALSFDTLLYDEECHRASFGPGVEREHLAVVMKEEEIVFSFGTSVMLYIITGGNITMRLMSRVREKGVENGSPSSQSSSYASGAMNSQSLSSPVMSSNIVTSPVSVAS